MKHQYLTTEHVRLLSIFAEKEKIDLKGELIHLANADIRFPALSQVLLDGYVYQLCEMGYLEQILNDNALPYKITDRGILAHLDYIKNEAQKILENDNLQEINQLELTLKRYQLKENGFMHTKILGLQIYIWISMLGLVIGLASIVIQLIQLK